MGEALHRNRKRKKKNTVWIGVLALVLAVALAIGVVLWGLGQRVPDGGSSSSATPAVPTTTARTLPKSFIDRNTSATHIALGDTTGRMLYSKKANEKAYPASLTKLLTAIVMVENTTPETEFTVGTEVYMIDPQSSRAYLTVGTRLTREQLLQAMLLPSGNDAAYVAAVQTGRLLAGNAQLSNQGALDTFTKKMNETASRLGCAGTHFANPDGIHRADHYTTAADMLKIAIAALQEESIARVVGQSSVNTRLLSGQTVTWANTNRLLKADTIYHYEAANGLKTGTTDQAGYCLAASASKDGQTSVAVVMGAQSESGRWEDARGLLELSFQ